MQANLDLDRTMLAYALHSKQFAMDLSNKITYEYFQTRIQCLYKAIMSHFTDPKFKEIPTTAIIEEYLNKHYSQANFIKEGLELFEGIKMVKIDSAEFTWHLDKFKKRYNDQVQRSCASKMVSLMKNSNAASDEELEDVVTSPFFSLRKTIQGITSETTIQRLLQKAKDVNRPAKTLREIELRLEEIQQS